MNQPGMDALARLKTASVPASRNDLSREAGLRDLPPRQTTPDWVLEDLANPGRLRPAPERAGARSARCGHPYVTSLLAPAMVCIMPEAALDAVAGGGIPPTAAAALMATRRPRSAA